MGETLINRVMRIVSGNIHDTIDAVETYQAETIMREALREIERTISEVKAETRKSNGNRLLAQKRQQMTDAKLDELSEKARIAISNNRDDLAEAALSRQLDLEAQIPVLKQAEETAEKNNDELNGFMQALIGRKSEMQSELDAFIEMRNEQNIGGVEGDGPNAVRLEDRADHAIEAFDRARKNGGGAAGYTSSDCDTVVQMNELNSIIRKKRISERLAELKQEQKEPVAS